MKISDKIKELRGEETVPVSETPPGENVPDTPAEIEIPASVGPDYAFPISSEEVYDMNAVKIPDYQLIRRLDTDDILTINSQRYSIKTHKEVVETAEEAMKEFEELKNPEKRTVLIRNGSRLILRYLFDTIKIEVDENEPLSLQLLLNNSYDRSCRIGMSLGCYRDRTQYYVVGKDFTTYRRKHYDSVSLKDLKDQIETAIEKWALLEKTFKDWTKQTLSVDVGVETIKKFKLPEKYEEVIVERWKLSNILSRWKLYNISHIIIRELGKSEERNEVLGTQVAKIFFK